MRPRQRCSRKRYIISTTYDFQEAVRGQGLAWVVPNRCSAGDAWTVWSPVERPARQTRLPLALFVRCVIRFQCAMSSWAAVPARWSFPTYKTSLRNVALKKWRRIRMNFELKSMKLDRNTMPLEGTLPLYYLAVYNIHTNMAAHGVWDILLLWFHGNK